MIVTSDLLLCLLSLRHQLRPGQQGRRLRQTPQPVMTTSADECPKFGAGLWAAEHGSSGLSFWHQTHTAENDHGGFFTLRDSLGITPPAAKVVSSVGAEQWCDSAGHRYKLGEGWVESSPAEGGLRVLVGAGSTSLLIQRTSASGLLANSTHRKHDPSKLFLNSLCAG